MIAQPWDERLQALRLARIALPRALPDRKDVLLKIEIMDAYRHGVRGAQEIAYHALERQGLRPQWITRDGVRAMVAVP